MCKESVLENVRLFLYPRDSMRERKFSSIGFPVKELISTCFVETSHATIESDRLKTI